MADKISLKMNNAMVVINFKVSRAYPAASTKSFVIFAGKVNHRKFRRTKIVDLVVNGLTLIRICSIVY